MKRKFYDIATILIDNASLESLEIRKLEPLSQIRTVMGVCIGPVEVSMALTAGLVYAAIYVALYEYESTNVRKVGRTVLRQFYRDIGVAGDARFGGRFHRVLEKLLHDLDSQDAMRRLGYTIQGDSSRLVTAVVESCVQWALRMIEGTGYMPEFGRYGSGIYEEVVAKFNAFAMKASSGIIFDGIIVEGGFKAIDLERLPTCDDKYDIFISYKKSDGDVYARLLNQDLSHHGFRCFLDVACVANGEYSLQILSALRNASHFLFLKTHESLDGIDNPDDHVRVELEAARFWRKNIIVVAPRGVTRDVAHVNLPPELWYLRDLRAYMLDVGEAYEFCIDMVVKCGIRHGSSNLA